jgi:hypothetical protein
MQFDGMAFGFPLRTMQCVEDLDRPGANSILDYPINGSHGLLLPKRHLRPILEAHWSRPVDGSIFSALRHDAVKVWQVIEPTLVEHIGEYSALDPFNRRRPETCYGN